jgi:hypothetical protein
LDALRTSEGRRRVLRQTAAFHQDFASESASIDWSSWRLPAFLLAAVMFMSCVRDVDHAPVDFNRDRTDRVRLAF